MIKQQLDTSNLREDIAVIKNQLLNLTQTFTDFRNDQRKFCDNITDKVDNIENKQISTDQKVSGLAIFQSVFSIIIGAIASYLGVNRK